MITLEVFVQQIDDFNLRELLVYFEFRLSSCFLPAIFFLFALLQGFAKVNHRSCIQICCEKSWSFSGNTSSKPKICCRKYNSSLLCATCCLNLQHYILLRDKLGTNMVIRATEGFTLQYNNVVRQVKEKCCPCYQTLKKHGWLMMVKIDTDCNRCTSLEKFT